MNKKRLILLLGFIVSLAYFNSFYGAWQLDDSSSITANTSIQINNFSLDFFKSLPKMRFLPYLSFAINYFFGGLNIIGFHIVNFIIHLLNTFLIYAITIELLRIKELNEDKVKSIAFWTAALWAVSPIQVGAVTYIVQRIASMAALFFFFSFLCYFLARKNRHNVLSKKKFIMFSILTLISYMCCVFTKENAILLPFSVLLTEYTLFKSISTRKLLFCCAATASLLFLIVLALYGWNLSDNFVIGKLLTNKFELFPFTPLEKLFLAPRILLYYVYLMLFPFVGNYRLLYDFDWVNASSHVYSYIAIVAVLFSFYYSWLKRKKNPYLFWGISFFLLNHIAESTIVEIDLAFEHRNYLPSLGLFFCLAYYLNKLKPIKLKRLCCLFLLVFSIFNTTILNNKYKHENCNASYDYRNEYKAQNELIAIIAASYYQNLNLFSTSHKIFRHCYEIKVNNAKQNKNLKEIFMYSVFYYRSYMGSKVRLYRNLDTTTHFLENNLLKGNGLMKLNPLYNHYVMNIYLDFLELKYFRLPESIKNGHEVRIEPADAFNDKIQRGYKANKNSLLLHNLELINRLSTVQLTNLELEVIGKYRHESTRNNTSL